jgi:superfamily II DNA or RNA helicase
MGNKSITFVHGTDPERAQKIEDFKAGRIKTLISTTILKEGVNIPIISNVINAVGGKSKVDIKQWMGRGERRHEDLKSFTMHDFYDIGRYVEAHSKVRIATYRKEKLDVTLHYAKEDIKKIK